MRSGRHAFERLERVSSLPAASADSAPVTAANRPEWALADLFWDLRGSLSLSHASAAQRTGTAPEVIKALERGYVDRLPPWPETVRIVTRYTALAGIDPRPVLQLIEQQIAVNANQRKSQIRMAYQGDVARGEMTGGPKPAAPIANTDHRQRLDRLWNRLQSLTLASGMSNINWRMQVPHGVRRLTVTRTRMLFAVGLPAILWIMVAEAPTLRGMANDMPRPVAQALRYFHDVALMQMAPVREGHRWIEVDDPRTRRSDKLQVTRR